VICALVLALLFASCPSVSAQAEPSPTTVSPPAASATSSPTLGDIAARLSRLSTELSREVADLRTSLEESRNALTSSQASLDLASKALRARNAELWIWRGTTAALAVGLVYSLVH
jgi:hypothetical protein